MRIEARLGNHKMSHSLLGQKAGDVSEPEANLPTQLKAFKYIDRAVIQKVRQVAVAALAVPTRRKSRALSRGHTTPPPLPAGMSDREPEFSKELQRQ